MIARYYTYKIKGSEGKECVNMVSVRSFFPNPMKAHGAACAVANSVDGFVIEFKRIS